MSVVAHRLGSLIVGLILVVVAVEGLVNAR
jgi:hypothetical protein